MKLALQVIASLIALVLAIPFAFFVYYWGTHIERRVSKGEAYGFEIGDSHAETLQKARILKAEGKIVAIGRGRGSSPKPIMGSDFPMAYSDEFWTIDYNPEWWNDTATLTFDDDQLVEIYRFRICCEMP